MKPSDASDPVRASARQPVKQNHILDELRKQIVFGDLRPGLRLPLRTKLQHRFNVSTATMQGALNRLIDEGFVKAQGRLGTFVSAHPPHLSHYGLAFPSPPRHSSGLRSQLWSALAREAQHVGPSEHRRFLIYQNVDGHTDTDVQRRLSGDMKDHRVAGIILAFVEENVDPGDSADTVLARPGDVPRVSIGTTISRWNLPTVCPDLRLFLDRALDFLVAKKRRRVALLTVTGPIPEHVQHFAAAAAARGLTAHPRWMQCVGFPEIQWAQNAAQLLMSQPAGNRPDAIVIFDENIVENALAGIADAGARIPKDVEVVAHSNFPCSMPGTAPITRLGFSVDRFLATSIDIIDAARRGLIPARVTMIPPVFESEIAHGNLA